MIKFTYLIKNRSIKAILFREVMHSNNKILLEKVAKNRKSIVVVSIEHFGLTPVGWNLIFELLEFQALLSKQSSLLFQEFTVDQWNF